MQLIYLATIVKMFGFLLKQNKATVLSKKKNHNRVVPFLFGFSYYKARWDLLERIFNKLDPNKMQCGWLEA